MSDSIAVDVVFAVLLVTTFACVGLVALWAAISPRRWFVRVGVVLVAFSPLFLISAYGLFLAFLLEVCLVVGGIIGYKRWRTWREQNKDSKSEAQQPTPSRWQFSVKSALAICTYAAVMAAIVANVPTETWSTWATIATTAFVAASITLLMAWVTGGSGTRRERFLCAFGFVFLLIGGAIISLRYPDLQLALLGYLLSYFGIYELGLALLLAVAAGVFVILIASALLYAAQFRSVSQRPAGHWRVRSRVALFAWVALLAAFPLFTFAKLLQPLPEPDNSLPVPNGFGELVRMGEAFANSTIKKELAPDVVDEVKLDAAVSNYDAEFAALRKALEIPCKVPIKYDLMSDIDTDATSALRNLAWVLDAKADANLRTGNIAELLACERDLLRLAQSQICGGLLVHYLCGSAIEGVSLERTYQAKTSLNSSDCKVAIGILSEYDANRASFEQVFDREMMWIAKTSGWPGRLGAMLQQLVQSGLTYDNLDMCSSQLYPKDQAIARLLIVDLALRAYQLDHNKLPQSLDALVPDYLSELPRDPFSPEKARLRYVLLDNTGYALWSIGPDGIDNDGQPLPKNEYGGTDLSAIGDLRLDNHLAPAPE